MEELELSLPFRENALKYVRHGMPDAKIEDVMGVAAARNNPGCVVKVLPSVVLPGGRGSFSWFGVPDLGAQIRPVACRPAMHRFRAH